METAIRKTKREIIGAKGSGDEEMFTAKSVLLRRQREEYRAFSQKANLLTQNERSQVYGFDRSVSAKASATYRKALTLGNGDATIGLKVQQFKKDLADGKINTSVDTQNQRNHVNGKAWKNQVKQAVQPGNHSVPKSRLSKGLDPQELINKYAGTGKDYWIIVNKEDKKL